MRAGLLSFSFGVLSNVLLAVGVLFNIFSSGGPMDPMVIPAALFLLLAFGAAVVGYKTGRTARQEATTKFWKQSGSICSLVTLGVILIPWLLSIVGLMMYLMWEGIGQFLHWVGIR